MKVFTLKYSPIIKRNKLQNSQKINPMNPEIKIKQGFKFYVLYKKYKGKKGPAIIVNKK